MDILTSGLIGYYLLSILFALALLQQKIYYDNELLILEDIILNMYVLRYGKEEVEEEKVEEVKEVVKIDENMSSFADDEKEE